MALLLKVILILLIIAMLVSLTGALTSLFKNQSDSKRLMSLLTIRVSLAALIVVVLVIGFVTGELSQQAPWVGQY